MSQPNADTELRDELAVCGSKNGTANLTHAQILAIEKVITLYRKRTRDEVIASEVAEKIPVIEPAMGWSNGRKDIYVKAQVEMRRRIVGQLKLKGL